MSLWLSSKTPKTDRKGLLSETASLLLYVCVGAVRTGHLDEGMADEDSATNRSASIRELLFSLELLGVLCCTETE